MWKSQKLSNTHTHLHKLTHEHAHTHTRTHVRIQCDPCASNAINITFVVDQGIVGDCLNTLTITGLEVCARVWA